MRVRRRTEGGRERGTEGRRGEEKEKEEENGGERGEGEKCAA